jgi:polysaccharide export outer membrane protein
MKFVFRLLFLSVFIFSCTPQRKLVYFQGNFSALNDSSSTGYFKLKIIPGDILLVNVFTINQEAFPYFNSATDKTGSDTRSPYEKGFVVSEKGTIQLPLTGEISVRDLTMAEASEAIKEKLKQYVEDPIVAVKKLNFKITVLGEVAHPGSFSIFNESVTLPEALGLAGDITSFGNKTTVKVIRSDNKIPRVIPVNMTDASSLTMENYFLHPDDIVYVEPVRRKALQNINPAITLITSLLTTTVVVISLLVK